MTTTPARVEPLDDADLRDADTSPEPPEIEYCACAWSKDGMPITFDIDEGQMSLPTHIDCGKQININDEREFIEAGPFPGVLRWVDTSGWTDYGNEYDGHYEIDVRTETTTES